MCKRVSAKAKEAKKPVVDIMVACAPHQVNEWWNPVMGMLLGEQKAGYIEIGALLSVSSALPDHNKNHSITSDPWNPEEKRRASLTDANRTEAAQRFMNGEADWLFSIDDDTVPPPGVITHLMGLGRELVGGTYFNSKPPYNPLAYYRRPDGLYGAVYDYVRGSVLRVDSIGMGCTLIHRSVFERIQAGHTLFQRPNGSLLAVRNEAIREVDAELETVPGDFLFGDWEYTLFKECRGQKENYTFIQKVQPLPEEKDNRAWPFFALEYGRTEDHYFCELAEHVGIEPYLDTAVECQHWKIKPTGRKEYVRASLAAREAGMQ